MSVTTRTINVAPVPVLFCRVLRNGRHSQPWGTPRGGSECQTDTIQDSFAALLPLLYRGRCRSIAMVRRSLNIETLFVSWTIFSAHTDTPLTTVLSTTQRHPDGQSERLQRSLLPLSIAALAQLASAEVHPAMTTLRQN